jgi:hypothetical protein
MYKDFFVELIYLKLDYFVELFWRYDSCTMIL